MIRSFGPLLLLAGNDGFRLGWGQSGRQDVSRGNFHDALRNHAQDFGGLAGRMKGPVDSGSCAARERNQCCAGSDWNCQAPGSTCSCDQMCKEFDDCCPDYATVCVESAERMNKCTLPTVPIMNNPPFEFPPFTPGEPSRIPEDHRLARASGDPHYHTFDGKTIHYQGGCIYRLTGLCDYAKGVNVEGYPLSDFVVYGKNFQRFKQNTNERRPMAWIQTVIVQFPLYRNNGKVNGRKLVILDQENNVRITNEYNDGTVISETVNTQNLPYTVENNQGNRIGFIYQRSSFVRVQVGSDGLTVGFNGKQNMRIHLPCQYNGNVCGLFGDADNDPSNDNKMANGEIANTENELGESWLDLDFPNSANLNADECDSEPMTTTVDDICPPDTLRQAASKCKALMDNQGPFVPCHASLPPAEYFEDCVYDLCLFFENALDHTEAMCEVYDNYATECREGGVSNFSWRDDLTECSVNCPAGESYYSELTYEETCTTTAQLSQGDSVEGCFCEFGKVRNDNAESAAYGNCIEKEDCPAVANSIVFNPPGPHNDDPNAWMNDEMNLIDFNPLSCLKEPIRVLDPIKSGAIHHAPSNWIKPDACCDEKPYNSGVEGCCGGKHLYDFNDNSCVGGDIVSRL